MVRGEVDGEEDMLVNCKCTDLYYLGITIFYSLIWR